MISAQKEECLEKKDRKWPWSVVYTLVITVVVIFWLLYFPQDLQALFSETSALSGDNVLQSHTTLASLLLEREDQDMEAIRQLSLKIPKQTSKKCRC